MRKRVGGILGSVAIALLASAAPALASSAGPDPAANFPMPYIPQLCWSPPTGDPTGPACLDWSMGVLNQARASMGLPAYVVPADFDSLSPAQQLFILTNSDRVAYGLNPIPGLTEALNQNASTGVQANSDPWPTGSFWMAYTSNWAGGYVNAVLAYEGWMYDDGPGSGNQDCTSTNPSGCWGHRHDVLWEFDGSGGATAMGAAAGSYSGGTPSYAMLLVQGSDASYQPAYSYTWTQAAADGANGGVTGSMTGSGTSSSGSGSQGSGSGSSGSGSSGSGTGSSGSGTSGSGTDSTTVSGTGSSGSGTSSQGSGSGSSGSGSSGSGTGSGSSGTGSGSGTGSSGSGTSGSGTGSTTGSGTGSSGSGSGSGSGSAAHGSGSGHEPGAHTAQGAVDVARVRVRGHHIRVHLAASPGLRITCSLRHWNGRVWRTERSKSCSAWTVFRSVPAGRYRLRVSSAAGTAGQRVVVR